MGCVTVGRVLRRGVVRQSELRWQLPGDLVAQESDCGGVGRVRRRHRTGIIAWNMQRADNNLSLSGRCALDFFALSGMK